MAEHREIELISFEICPYVQRAAITLLEKDIPHKVTYIDLAEKPDWFLKISPLGKVPVLKIGEDALFESTAICEYLDELTMDKGRMHPEDILEKARHRGWMEYASVLLGDLRGFYDAEDDRDLEKMRLHLQRRLEKLEDALGRGTFFSGEEFRLVDAVFAPVLRYFDVLDRIGETEILKDLPKIQKYRENLMARPSVRQAVPEDYMERVLEFFAKRNSRLLKRAA